MVITAAKAPLVAAGAFTAPLIWPWGQVGSYVLLTTCRFTTHNTQAALKNWQVRGKFDYVGLWKARVLEIRLVQQGRPLAVPPPPRPSGQPSGVSTLLVVGDDSGARAELVVDYSYRHDVVQVGEAAELLVLSTDRDLQRFKVR